MLYYSKVLQGNSRCLPFALPQVGGAPNKLMLAQQGFAVSKHHCIEELFMQLDHRHHILLLSTLGTLSIPSSLTLASVTQFTADVAIIDAVAILVLTA